MKKKIFWTIIIVIATIAIAFLFFFLIKNNDEAINSTIRIKTDNTTIDNKIVNMQGHWKNEDLREDFVLETIKEFELRNPGIKTNIKWNMDFEGGRIGAIEETIEQFKTGDIKWDIIWLEPFYYQEIANELGDQNWGLNHLVNFENIDTFNDSQKPFILSDPQYRNHMNGIITGPYIEGFYQPLFYNKNLADEIGLEIKNSNMTFDDLFNYFKQISEYNEKNGTNIPILYDSGDYKGGIGYAPSTWNIFQSLFRSEINDINEAKSTEPSEKKLLVVKKVLESIEKLSQFKPLIPGWKDLPWFDTRYYVLEDRAVFTACGASWMYSHWHGIDAEKTMNMVPVEMPVYQPINYYIGGYNPMFAVAKNSPVKNEAIELLMTFAKPASAEKWIRYAKAPSGIQGNVSMAGEVSKETDQYDNFISYITDKYTGNVFDSKTVDYILGEKYKDLTLQFNIYLGSVMDGEMTANEAYDNILNDMNEIDNK